jgi:acyl-coenzyme A synthetase/AMP-(fatty) acid ligase
MSNPASTRKPPPSLAADTVPLLWRALVDAHGERVMLRVNGETFTFRDIDQRSAALARGLLANGAGRGARIGILAPNGAAWVIAWLAANRIGAIAVCLSTLFSAPELAFAVAHADLSILICADRYLRHDYVTRLEEAFPGLGEQDGAGPLALAAAPYLRGVWFTRPSGRAWSKGSLAQLEAEGLASPVFSADLLAAVEAAVSPADLALLIYTSGSTALPKGVAHTQSTVVRKPIRMGDGKGIIPVIESAEDRIIVPSPFFWVGGFLGLTGAMIHGARVICSDDHSPAALLETIRRGAATGIIASEAVLRAIQALPSYRAEDFARLRAQTAHQQAFFHPDPATRARAPHSLGMTETLGPHSGDVTGALLPPEAVGPGAVGRALGGMEYKIVDPDTGAVLPPGEAGELCVRGLFLMDGMYKRERAEVFDADGYYHTGDQCVLNADGYLYFVSRISGMIKTSGANVSPEEVEVALLAEDGVIEAAVMGVDDPKVGEIVVAAVVASPGSDLTEQALQARLRTRLSSFKVPRRIFFFDFDDLPRTPSNKIRKPPLAQQITGMMAQADAT